MVLRVQVGSGVDGTSISGQDDRDEMGICFEPAEYVTGLARVPNGIGGEGPAVEFEQYERHTAWDRPGGVANRSGAGDLDVVIYSARKWCRLALAGNPTVLLVLFVPDPEVVYRNETGAELVDNARRFVSRLAAERFLGYLNSQKAAMIGEAGAHTNRPELVVTAISQAEAMLTRLAASSAIPAEPDRAWVDRWLHRSYLVFWATSERSSFVAGV